MFPGDNGKKTFRKNCRSFFLMASVIIASTANPTISIAAQSNIPAKSLEHSKTKTFTWTNLDTKKTVEIPSGWTVTMSLHNNEIFTIFHETLSGAEITVYHEKTTDDVHAFAADMLKIYPKRHIEITQSEFYTADAGTFWLASGKVESEPNKQYEVAIHNKDGRMWLVSSLYPEWMMTNSEWNKVSSAVNASTL